MTQLAKANQATAPVRQAKGRDVARILQLSEEVLQRPWRVRADLDRRFPLWRRNAVETPPSINTLRRDDDRGAWARDKAAATLGELPAPHELQEALHALAELEASQPDRRKTELLVAVMVDGYPNARPHSPEAYVESLVHEAAVERFPAGVVAQACRELARTKPFPPSVAEFLEACRTAEAIRGSRSMLERAMATRAAFEDALAEAKRLGPIDLVTEQSDRWRVILSSYLADRRWNRAALGAPPGELGCRVPLEIQAEFGIEQQPNGGDGVPRGAW